MEETIVKQKDVFTLPKEVITLKFIKRRRGLATEVADNHVISGGMLDGAVKKFCAPLERSGNIKNVLTDSEKEFLEKATGLNLSVYGGFWNSFWVHLYKDDNMNKIDLSTPMGYISYKVLKHLTSDIAPSWKQRNDKLSYMFAITKDEDLFDEEKAKLDSKKEAWKLYGKIEDDKEKLIDILRLLSNKSIAESSSLKWIQGQVESILDSNPKSFLSVVQDKHLDIKILINKAVTKGYITKSNNKYSTVDGLDLCEQGQVPSFDNAVLYLDNPKNQDVKSLIEAKVL